MLLKLTLTFLNNAVQKEVVLSCFILLFEVIVECGEATPRKDTYILDYSLVQFIDVLW